MNIWKKIIGKKIGFYKVLKMRLNNKLKIMTTFLLLKRQLSNDNSPRFEWWEKGEKYENTFKLYNRAGGWNVIFESDEIVETVQAKDWKALNTPENIAKTTTYQTLVENSTNSELKLGWLSPQGKMHYCTYQNHISYANLILGKDSADLEEEGWLHVYKDNIYLQPNNGMRMTQEQARTAREELNLRVMDEDILYQ